MYYSFFKLFSLSLPHFLGSLLVHFNVASPTFAGTLCFGLFVFFSCQTNIDCLLFPLLFRVGLFALGAFLGFWVASFALSLPVRPLLPPPPQIIVFILLYVNTCMPASQPACLFICRVPQVEIDGRKRTLMQELSQPWQFYVIVGATCLVFGVLPIPVFPPKKYVGAKLW